MKVYLRDSWVGDSLLAVAELSGGVNAYKVSLMEGRGSPEELDWAKIQLAVLSSLCFHENKHFCSIVKLLINF